MSVFKKLNQARTKFHASEIKKSGENKFAKYKYFELADFVVPAIKIFEEVGLCAIVSFDKEYARMFIVDVDDSKDAITITSPMATADLKGCHPIQNMGAIETYQRRYLWMAALEIVEHDIVDSSEPINENKQYAELCEKHADSITVIKEAIAAKDLSTASEAWFELDNTIKEALWKAPSKGGCFTTEERAIMKSTEFRTANGG